MPLSEIAFQILFCFAPGAFFETSAASSSAESGLLGYLNTCADYDSSGSSPDVAISLTRQEVTNLMPRSIGHSGTRTRRLTIVSLLRQCAGNSLRGKILSKQDVVAIRGDAVKALIGAEAARAQLLAALSLGPASIYNYLYAVKCRIKSEDSFVKKVIKKQKEKDPAYRANDVTDVIGLRLLTLHSQELLPTCRRFMDFVRFGSLNDCRLFAGLDPLASIKEVIVFRTPSAPPSYIDCYNFFEKTFRNVDSVTPKLEETRQLPGEKMYSSIHIVCLLNSYHQGRTSIVPLEVQIRTGFEDIWGEIQHKLEYKAGDIEFPDERIGELYKETVSALDTLKRQVDICGESADKIRNQIDQITSISLLDPLGAFHVNGQIVDSRIHHPDIRNDVPVPGLEEQLVELESTIQDAHTRINLFLSDMRNGSPTDIISKLKSCVDQIDSIRGSYREIDQARYESDGSARYIFFMEEALCLFWIGRILKISGRTKEKSDDYFARSESIYRGVVSDNAYRQDAICRYRLGHVLLSQGRIDEAFGFLELAHERLEVRRDDVTSLPHFEIDPHHLYDIKIRRLFAYCNWVISEKLAESSRESGLAPPESERREKIEFALRENVAILDKFQGEKFLSKPDYEKNLRNAANDAVCYASDLVEILGSVEAVRSLGVDLEGLLAKAVVLGVGQNTWKDEHSLLIAKAYFDESATDDSGLRDFREKIVEGQLKHPAPAPEEADYMLRTIDSALQYLGGHEMA